MKKRWPRAGRLMAVLVVFLTWFPPAFAHDGINAQIARLTIELEGNPDNASLWLRRGELFRANRQWREALADLDRAARLDASLARVELVRAHVFLESSRPHDAIAAADRFLARDPDQPDALTVRARARVALRRFAEAAADFTRVVEVRPLPDLYLERARAERATGPRGLAPALRGLDEGLARLGSIVTLELEALDIERSLGQFDRALARIDRLTAQAARKEQWLARRGAVLEQAGRPVEARASYAAALAATQQLPPWTQRTRATRQLVDSLRADLGRLN
jgi:tetratricopeptide (TPR) repeat protein